jgi:hypothetical protein
MVITKKDKLLVETFCDLCKASQGTSLIDKKEYPDWLKQTTDLLTFIVYDGPTSTALGRDVLLCWECIKQHGLTREYDRRLNDLTYPKERGKA